MSGVVFEPWIGSKYFNSNRFGVRVLILGESHYAPDNASPTFTSQIVRDEAQDGRHSFFTKVSKVLLGLGNGWIDDETRSEVWEHVAFYNYIQGLVGKGSRIRPSQEMWANSRRPFLYVLNELKPDVLLVLGKQLANNLPGTPDSIEVCQIQHPSTGFVYSKWNPLFVDAVRRAKNGR